MGRHDGGDILDFEAEWGPGDADGPMMIDPNDLLDYPEFDDEMKN